MKRIPGFGKKLTTRVSKILRPRSPGPTRRDRQADRSSTSTPTPMLHAPTNDDSASRSVTPVPTIAVNNSPKSLAPPSKKFFDVKPTNAQQDIAVLHVAYILQKSSNLQRLVLEIVKFDGKKKEFNLEDIVQDCIAFVTRLMAALDSPTVAPAGVEQAIVVLLKTIESIDWKDLDKASREIKESIGKIEIAHPDISTIEQKKDSTGCFSKIRSKSLGVTLPMLDILKTGSSMIPVPMVHPLIGVVAGFFQAADQASSNFEWMRWLSSTAAECVIGIALRCSEKTEQPWTEAIDTLQRKLSGIVQQAEKFCRRSVVSRFLQQGCDKGDIEMMKEDLKAAFSNFYVQVGMNVKLDLDKMSRQIEVLSLETLPRLPSDKFSQDVRFQASRDQEIGVILRWIEDSDMSFFWIHGAAGIGKSTLAHHLFDLLKAEGILGTFAFFSIGNDIDPKELVRMMARELSSLHPGCRPAVAQAIIECFGTHQSLEAYLVHFLVRPITSLAYAGSLVIILDALDEWVHREQFLKALRQVNLPTTLSLKFVMTSRYSEDIKSIVDGAATSCELTPVSATICRKYFEERFDDLVWDGPRPDEVKLGKLVELADGFLIWAATVCTLVSTPDPEKLPFEILNEIISSSLNLGHEERMEGLYREALKRIFPAKNEALRLKLFLSMVALREDLSLSEFARLVKMTPRFIQDVCSRLRALQTRGTFQNSMVQPANKLFHASFIEHLGQMKEAHGVMADNCIHFVKQVIGSDNVNITEALGPFPFYGAERYIGKHWMYHWHLQEASPEKHSNLFLNVPPWLNYYDDLLAHCFEHLWDLSDINMSILVFENAVQFTPHSHPNKPFWLNNLGNFYLHRFERLGDLSDINISISAVEDALQLIPDGHSDKPLRLNNLGNLLLCRFKHLGNFDDINKSILMFEDAVQVSDDHPNKPSWLNNLGISLVCRFESFEDLADIDQSILVFMDAVRLTPDGHPDKPSWLSNLGNSLVHHFECLEDLSSIKMAGAMFEEAGKSCAGSSLIRFLACSRWATCCQYYDSSFENIFEAYSLAFHLLSSTIGLGLSVAEYQCFLKKVEPIIMEAVAVAIDATLYETALEWMNQGHFFIGRELLQLQTPVNDLRKCYPDIAERFIILSKELEKASNTGLIGGQQLPTIDTSKLEHYHDIAEERDRLLDHIRELNGFEHFLLPWRFSQLRVAAHNGPVISINVGKTHCDALILMPELDNVLHISLDNFTLQHAEQLHQQLTNLLNSRAGYNRNFAHDTNLDKTRAPMRRYIDSGIDSATVTFETILANIWETIVRPILNGLGFFSNELPKQKLPRMWWHLTGPLFFLPIHAAGLYGPKAYPGSKLSDFVVSSYIPTLSNLIDNSAHLTTPPNSQVLAIALPMESHLPGTMRELDCIAKRVGSSNIKKLLDSEATIENVIAGLRESSFAHFACHSVLHPTSPNDSGFLLANQSRLTLSHLHSLSLSNAQLAFLSACQTAVGVQQLAAGMLSAGYRGVIATMWDIQDRDGPIIADEVYTHLFKDSEQPDPSQAAHALHYAVKRLVEGSNGTKKFWEWVPFIHIGI